MDTDRETCYNNAVLEKSVKQTILEEDADMSDEMKKLSEKQLDAVSGGTTANLVAAYDVLAGKYGEGQDRVNRLSAAGYNYNDVQSLVNALCKGYGPVAADVVNGRYGNPPQQPDPRGLRPRSGSESCQQHGLGLRRKRPEQSRGRSEGALPRLSPFEEGNIFRQ